MPFQQDSTLSKNLIIFSVTVFLLAVLITLFKRLIPFLAKHRLYISSVGALCGIIAYVACNKLLGAIGFAMGWYGPYAFKSINIEEVPIGTIFGVLWAFKKTSAIKASFYQGIILTFVWIIIQVTLATFSGYTPNSIDVWHNLITVTISNASSGFVTAWSIPHVLSWLSRVSTPATTTSFSKAHEDTTYEI